jgi:predicted ABC-type transport system involved in lysophospholipase L1 biosynthesis ATPase subunit
MRIELQGVARYHQMGDERIAALYDEPTGDLDSATAEDIPALFLASVLEQTRGIASRGLPLLADPAVR